LLKFKVSQQCRLSLTPALSMRKRLCNYYTCGFFSAALLFAFSSVRNVWSNLFRKAQHFVFSHCSESDIFKYDEPIIHGNRQLTITTLPKWQNLLWSDVVHITHSWHQNILRCIINLKKSDSDFFLGYYLFPSTSWISLHIRVFRV
jgi:hypothetical protein